MLAAGAIALVAITIGSGLTGPASSSTHAAITALAALLVQGSVALLWMAMAFGFGSALTTYGNVRAVLDRAPAERLALEGALGITAALSLDALLGTTGVLLWAPPLGAWALTLCGLIFLVMRMRSVAAPWPQLRVAPAVAATGLAAGVLLVAAVSEPGWLWRSEFGGYDALSYHLQLPREWIAGGRIATLDHNVYSAFPSFVEAAFLHVFLLAGDLSDGAISAQCLAVLFTLHAAFLVACIGRRVAGDAGAALAAALYLGTPWIVVVGSLAYNDNIVPLFLAAGLLLTWRRPARGLAVALGLLLGAACGAKLTAVGFVALPLALGVALRARWRAVPVFAVTAVVAAVVLLPWLVRNGIATGNPTFPFLTQLFGTGHWTAAQSAVFESAHRAGTAAGPPILRLWTQWFAFGFGSAPVNGEPWFPLWSILPWLGLLGCGALLITRTRRGVAILLLTILVLQLGFWLTATHLQSRFLVPTAVPLAIGGAGLLRLVAPRRRSHVALGAAFIVCCAPAVTYRTEGPLIEGVRAPALAIGARAMFTGEATKQALVRATSDRERAEIIASATAAFSLAFEVPADVKVLLLGDAAPFWYRRAPASLTYTTVWDRGPLDAIAADMPDQPELWGSALQGLGFQYVLINESMLRNWAEKGWLNPQLTLDRLGRFVRSTYHVRTFGNGSMLVRLAPPPSAPSSAAPNSAAP